MDKKTSNMLCSLHTMRITELGHVVLYVTDIERSAHFYNELELYADVSDIWKQDPHSLMEPVKPLDLNTHD